MSGHTHAVKAIAVSPNGRLVASGDEDGWLRLSAVEGGTVLRHVRALRVSSKRVRRIRFAHDGAIWLTDGENRVRRLVDPEHGEAVTVAESDPAHYQLEMLPGNAGHVVGGSKGIVRVHASGSADPPLTLSTGAAIADLAVHADGRRLAVAHVDGRVDVWDLLRGERLVSRAVQKERFFAIRWIPGPDALLATGGADGTLRLLDASATNLVLGQRVLEVLRKRYPGAAKRWQALETKHAAALRVGPDHEAAFRMLEDIPTNHLGLFDARSVAVFEHELRGEDHPSVGLFLIRVGAALHVQRVLAGGPAAVAGIRRGDRIIAVDGVAIDHSPRLSWRTDDAPLADRAIYLLHGRLRDRLRLTISPTADAERDVDVVVVPYSSLRGDKAAIRTVRRGAHTIGILPLSYVYSRDSSRLVGDALKGPLAACDGIVLDLRGRGGSRFEQWAVQAVFEPRKGPASWTKPVAVLIDRDTRSAKELMARWFKQRGWALVVGEETAGAMLPAEIVRIDARTSLLCPAAPLMTKPQDPVTPDVMQADAVAFVGGADPILERGITSVFERLK